MCRMTSASSSWTGVLQVEQSMFAGVFKSRIALNVMVCDIEHWMQITII